MQLSLAKLQSPQQVGFQPLQDLLRQVLRWKIDHFGEELNKNRNESVSRGTEIWLGFEGFCSSVWFCPSRITQSWPVCCRKSPCWSVCRGSHKSSVLTETPWKTEKNILEFSRIRCFSLLHRFSLSFQLPDLLPLMLRFHCHSLRHPKLRRRCRPSRLDTALKTWRLALHNVNESKRKKDLESPTVVLVLALWYNYWDHL